MIAITTNICMALILPVTALIAFHGLTHFFFFVSIVARTMTTDSFHSSHWRGGVYDLSP